MKAKYYRLVDSVTPVEISRRYYMVIWEEEFWCDKAFRDNFGNLCVMTYDENSVPILLVNYGE